MSVLYNLMKDLCWEEQRQLQAEAVEKEKVKATAPHEVIKLSDLRRSPEEPLDVPPARLVLALSPFGARDVGVGVEPRCVVRGGVREEWAVEVQGVQM